MKLLVALTVLFNLNTSFAHDYTGAKDLKYITHFTKFSCKSFRDQTTAPAAITELGMNFSHLGISRDLDTAIIDLTSSDGECRYSALYKRDKENREIAFQDSWITGTCQQANKEDIDFILSQGFKFVLKYNYYVALKFLAEFKNPCEEVSGNFLVEFELGE